MRHRSAGFGGLAVEHLQEASLVLKDAESWLDMAVRARGINCREFYLRLRHSAALLGQADAHRSEAMNVGRLPKIGRQHVDRAWKAANDRFEEMERSFIDKCVNRKR